MQEQFDLIGDDSNGNGSGDQYMDNGIEDDLLDFDLDMDPNSMPSTNNPLQLISNPSQNRHLLPQQSSVQPSVEVDSNILPDPGDQPPGRTAVGAGPLPSSHGVQLAPTTGTTVTDFTKRRNWSQRVIEEIRDFLFLLSPDGRFLWVSPSTPELTGYEPEEVVRKLVSDYIHPDDTNVFVREFNESIATGNSLRFFYRFRKKDGTYTIFESHGHPHLATEASPFGQNAGSSFCRGFFMMARPYPTKNAALLDSFLEHKIENERLRKRISDLKREEQEEADAQQQMWFNRPHDTSAQMSRSPYPQLQRNSSGSPNYSGMPPPIKPNFDNNALTQQNLDEALAASRPDSINDKMARYEGTTPLETIEMLTGLNYRDGERSKGISTGAQSPTLIKGDAGIAIPVDRDGRPTQGMRGYSENSYGEMLSNEKKKKLKVADEYVCTDCGTLDSPEWRKGPTGPKTLCNACGLRWAKKEKKRNPPAGEDGGNGNGNGQDGTENAIAQMAAGQTSQGTQLQPIQPSTAMPHPPSLPMDTTMGSGSDTIPPSMMSMQDPT